MTSLEPTPHLDTRYSSDGAEAPPWGAVRQALQDAELFWLTTVRPDGRPHATPLLAVWDGCALWFCTGPEERKARNLEGEPSCLLLTGRNLLHSGLDLAVEGVAVRVTDDEVLGRIAAAYVAKYGPDWRFEVRDGAFVHAAESLREADPGRAVVYRVAPTAVFGFGKGDRYSQTRWTFDADPPRHA